MRNNVIFREGGEAAILLKRSKKDLNRIVVDRLINKHIDTIEELERQQEMIIEQEVSQINIDAILTNPQAELARVADNIKRIFLDEYADQAVELGFDFGKAVKAKIEADNKIKVDNSKDPQLNEPD